MGHGVLRHRVWGLLLGGTLVFRGVLGCTAAPPGIEPASGEMEEAELRDEAIQEAAWMAFARGTYLRERGSSEGALVFYAHAVRLAPQQPSFRLALARQNLEVGRLKEAEKVLQKAADRGEAIPAEHLLMARLRLVSGRSDAALQSLDRALAADSTLAAAWVLRGRLLMDQHDLGQSLASLQRADILEPNLPPTLVLLGGVLQKLGRQDEAVRAYRRALFLDPEMRAARNALVELYEEAGLMDEAIQVRREAWELDPDDGESFEALLQLYLKAQREQDALDLLEPRYQRGELEPRQEYALGWLYLQLEQPRQAEEVLQALAAKAPLPAVENLLGELALREERPGEAESRFRAAIALDADDCSAHVGLVTALLERSRSGPDGQQPTGAALDSLRTVLAEASLRTPADALRCNVLLGYAYASLRDFQAALPHLEAARALEPENMEILFNLAMAHQEMGQFDQALDLGRHVLGREPKNAAALNFVGYIQAERGLHLEESEAMIRKALQVEPDNGYFVDSLGWVFYQMGRFDEAAQELERAVELTGAEDPIILEHLGDAYREAGRLDAAHRTYLKSKDLDPSNRGIQEKIEELEKRLGKP